MTRGHVAVVGAGLMGAQIGVEYALGGYDVVLITRSAASAADSVERARDALRFLAANGLAEPPAADAAAGRLSGGADVSAGCAGAAVVVESVTEALATKAEVLRRAAAAAPEAILASNTSSLSITELGRACGAAERTVGTHYWNPPTLMPLVETIPGAQTRPDVLDGIVAILRGLGKEPVVVGDVTGFVWNRLQFALLREAAHLVRAGVVDPATVDVIVRRGLGRRWSLIGPFETMALGGADTFRRVAEILFPILAATRDAELLAEVPPLDDERVLEARRRRDAGLIELRRRDLAEP